MPAPDVFMAAALALIGLLEIALANHPRVWPDALIAATVTLAVAVRRTLPLLGTLTVSGALVALVASGEKSSRYLFLLIGVVIVMYSLGSYGSRRERLVGLAIAIAAATASAAFEKGHGVSDALFGAGVVAVPWTVGLVSHRRESAAIALRERTELLEREQEARERAAVAAERDRIARELHDIVAHAVTLMVLQANAGDRQLDADPQAAREAFGVIRESGKSALLELRRMLNLLHGGGQTETVTPQPSLTDIEDLVARSRRAGVAVNLELGDCGEIPESVAVAAYRLVQEAITNANRYAHGVPVTVRVARENGALRLRVHNGAGKSVEGTPGGGHGLAGMRERVKVFGGHLAAGPTPDGGFAVDVALPVEIGS